MTVFCIDQASARIIRAYCTFIVAALPSTMATKARMEPSARVEKPVMPWPMVQPIASTPPKPIRIAPTRWLTKSRAEANHSMRKLRETSDHSREPATTPASAMMPKVSRVRSKPLADVAEGLPHRVDEREGLRRQRAGGGGAYRVGRRIQIPV